MAKFVSSLILWKYIYFRKLQFSYTTSDWVDSCYIWWIMPTQFQLYQSRQLELELFYENLKTLFCVNYISRSLIAIIHEVYLQAIKPWLCLHHLRKSNRFGHQTTNRTAIKSIKLFTNALDLFQSHCPLILLTKRTRGLIE